MELTCRSALRDDQWERLAALNLPGVTGHVGRTAQNNPLFVEAVPFRFRAGIAWRDLTARFGNWHRIYVRFHRSHTCERWKRSGVWQKVFEPLSHDKDNEYAMIGVTHL